MTVEPVGWWIRRAILKVIGEKSRIIRLPLNRADEMQIAFEPGPIRFDAVETALSGGSYVTEEAIERLEKRSIQACVAIAEEENGERSAAGRNAREAAHRGGPVHLLHLGMGRRIYVKRVQTVEPFFVILKVSMGFRRFLLRWLAKARIERDLVCMAYNMGRLRTLADSGKEGRREWDPWNHRRLSAAYPNGDRRSGVWRLTGEKDTAEVRQAPRRWKWRL